MQKVKILIIGPLGAGKSSLAYTINRKFRIPRLILDEICRNPADGNYYPQEEQFAKLSAFTAEHSDWVAEGSQKYLYEKLVPDLIVDMRINRWVAMWRFSTRFIKAKRLIGKNIPTDLPVQPYHYRPITLAKIRDYDVAGQEIDAEIAEFLQNTTLPVLTCKSFRDYPRIFAYINQSIK